MTDKELLADITGWKRGRAQLLTKLLDEVENLSRFDVTCERRYLNFNEVLALLEKELG